MIDHKITGRWNYRIVRHSSGDLALHEVFYDDAGAPKSMTTNPATFACFAEEGREGIIKSLEMALNDARQNQLFIPPESWGH